MTSDDVLRVGRPDLSPGIYRGLLKEVVDGDGTGLFGAHAAGATVLNVAAGAFRTAGLCRVDGTVYAYVRDGDTLAITPPLVAAAEDGEPVESLTPSGETEVSRVAVIDLDMDGDPENDVRAVISGDLAGYYPLGDVAAGALVTVKDTAYGYEVAGRPNDAPTLDGATVDLNTNPDYVNTVAVANAAAAAAADAATNADLAMTSADGKTKITISTSTPGATPNTAGVDVWWQKDAATQTIIGQWTGLGGTSWQQVTVADAMIANLSAGKLVAGSAFTNALSVKTNFTLGDATTNGVIQSYDFAGSSVGVFIDKFGLVAKGGSITGATVTGGLVRTTETDGNFIELTSGLIEWHQGGTSGAIDPTVARFGSTPGVEVRSAGAYKGKLILEGSNSGSSFTKATLTAANVEIIAGVQATVTGGLTVSGGVDATGTGTFHNQLHGNTVYSDVSAGGGTTAASIDDNGKILRTPPSTRRVKENIEAHEVDVDALLGVGVFRFTYTEDVPDVDHDEIQVGLMAEDLAAAGFDQWVVRNRAGEISGIAYERLSVPLLAVAQRQQQQIADLSTQLAALADRVAALEEAAT